MQTNLLCIMGELAGGPGDRRYATSSAFITLNSALYIYIFLFKVTKVNFWCRLELSICFFLHIHIFVVLIISDSSSGFDLLTIKILFQKELSI